jgi:hypothetical protein
MASRRARGDGVPSAGSRCRTADGGVPDVAMGDKSSARAQGRGRRGAASDTRSDIIRAAKAQFARAGYDAMTFASIAKAVDVDPTLIAHYFGGKEQLSGVHRLGRRLGAVTSLTPGRRLPHTSRHQNLLVSTVSSCSRFSTQISTCGVRKEGSADTTSLTGKWLSGAQAFGLRPILLSWSYGFDSRHPDTVIQIPSSEVSCSCESTGPSRKPGGRPPARYPGRLAHPVTSETRTGPWPATCHRPLTPPPRPVA